MNENNRLPECTLGYVELKMTGEQIKRAMEIEMPSDISRNRASFERWSEKSQTAEIARDELIERYFKPGINCLLGIPKLESSLTPNCVIRLSIESVPESLS